jgi:hypothetical protein
MLVVETIRPRICSANKEGSNDGTQFLCPRDAYYHRTGFLAGIVCVGMQ